MGFGGDASHFISHAKIQRQVWAEAPVVLHVSTEHSLANVTRRCRRGKRRAEYQRRLVLQKRVERAEDEASVVEEMEQVVRQTCAPSGGITTCFPSKYYN
jgi:hypothetical protein